MTPSRKTWQEKLADIKGLSKFVKLEQGFPCFNAVHKMGAEGYTRPIARGCHFSSMASSWRYAL